MPHCVVTNPKFVVVGIIVVLSCMFFFRCNCPEYQAVEAIGRPPLEQLQLPVLDTHGLLSDDMLRKSSLNIGMKYMLVISLV